MIKWLVFGGRFCSCCVSPKATCSAQSWGGPPKQLLGSRMRAAGQEGPCRAGSRGWEQHNGFLTSFAHDGLHFQSLTSCPGDAPLFPFFSSISLQSAGGGGADPSGELAATVQEVAVNSKLRQKAASLDKRRQVCCGAAAWDRAERWSFKSCDGGAAALIPCTCAPLVSLRRSGSGSRCGYLALN